MKDYSTFFSQITTEIAENYEPDRELHVPLRTITSAELRTLLRVLGFLIAIMQYI